MLASYSFGQVMWSMFVFFAWILFFMLLFRVFGDLFSRHDIGGGAKVGWTVFVIVLPFLGIFVYLISQGQGMGERAVKQMQAQQSQMDDYVRSVASSSPAEEIDKAKALLDSGAITQAESKWITSRLWMRQLLETLARCLSYFATPSVPVESVIREGDRATVWVQREPLLHGPDRLGRHVGRQVVLEVAAHAHVACTGAAQALRSAFAPHADAAMQRARIFVIRQRAPAGIGLEFELAVTGEGLRFRFGRGDHGFRRRGRLGFGFLSDHGGRCGFCSNFRFETRCIAVDACVK